MMSEVSAAEEPFYRRWWFLVIVALVGIIVILVVVAVLYITGRKRQRTVKRMISYSTSWHYVCLSQT